MVCPKKPDRPSEAETEAMRQEDLQKIADLSLASVMASMNWAGCDCKKCQGMAGAYGVFGVVLTSVAEMLKGRPAMFDEFVLHAVAMAKKYPNPEEKR